jgi:hypothetical protein
LGRGFNIAEAWDATVDLKGKFEACEAIDSGFILGSDWPVNELDSKILAFAGKIAMI